jgi:O-methyltransferase
MYRYLQDNCVNGAAIDYLEFGVFKGESIREWATINTHAESRFFGFDSFEGLPEDWRDGQAKGHFGVHGAVPDFDDRRVTFVKGWFDKTIPTFVRQFAPHNRLVLHLDADLYSSTMLALIYLTPFMSKGTLLIFDEFYDRQHEYKAFRDWLRVTGKSFQVLAQVGDMGKITVQVS